MRYQPYALQRAIRQYGVQAQFYRAQTNEFGCEGRPQRVFCCAGLFHPSNSFLTLTVDNAGQIPTPKRPMLLIAATDEVRLNDAVLIHGKQYSVTGLDDVGGLGFCFDLSLQEVAP